MKIGDRHELVEETIGCGAWQTNLPPTQLLPYRCTESPDHPGDHIACVRMIDPSTRETYYAVVAIWPQQ